MFAERKVIPLHTRVPAEDGEAEFGPNVPDMNVRVLWGLAQWVRDRRGDEVLAQVAEAADVRVENLDGRSHWVSHDRFESFLAGCRKLMSSDEQFEAACTHRLPEAYGALRFALRAVSPRLMYVQAAKNLHMVSRISTVEVLEEGDNFIRTRYRTERRESPLMSLSRDAQTQAMPSLWGLPKADLRVVSRDERGNTEYEVRWQVKPTWLRTLGAAGLGAMVALVVSVLEIDTSSLALFSLPLLAGAIGYIHDLRRSARLNQALSGKQTEALEELAAEAFEAKKEAIELSSRHLDWSRMMDVQVQDRNRELRMLRDRLRGFGQNETDPDRILGGVHDLRSPLQVISATVELLRRDGQTRVAHKAALEELDRSTRSMNSNLEELMNSFSVEPTYAIGEPEVVVTEELAEVLLRRLKAFVLERGVRTTVISTREAPDQIVVNQLILDRVLDNLLTNATKYTERGSILVEVGGTPGYLTIKVSDTGRGIEQEKLRAVFVPGGSDQETRAPSSHGVGLSNVLRLMDEIGGRLEVMSKVGHGSTFWAHFPCTPPDTASRDDRGDDAPYAELLDRVVTIRRT